MPHENSPLLTCGLSGLLSGLARDGQDEPLDMDGSLGDPATSRARSLNTFFGVIVPTVLSMFSIVLFLRTGEEWVMLMGGSMMVINEDCGNHGYDCDMHILVHVDLL